MSTPNYNLPTISGTEVADFVGDLNALANATDSALKAVENAASTYVLPTATAYVKGGVKIGKGIEADSDGTISVKLAAGEVGTDALATGAVTEDKLSQTVAASLANGNQALTQANAALNAFNAKPTPAGTFSSGSGTIEAWGRIAIVHAEQLAVPTGTKTLVGTVGVGYRPNSETTVPVSAFDGSGNIVIAFLKVETGGNIYINPGGKTGLNWTGTAIYLLG
jgi:hypothetical protein